MITKNARQDFVHTTDVAVTSHLARLARSTAKLDARKLSNKVVNVLEIFL
jgi:hypothetical protein